MRHGDKRSLKLRRGEKNPAIEHLAEESRITICVGPLCVTVVAHRLGCEKERRQRSCRVNFPWNASFGQRLTQLRNETVGLFVDAFVESGARELFKSRNPSLHRQRISR